MSFLSSRWCDRSNRFFFFRFDTHLNDLDCWIEFAIILDGDNFLTVDQVGPIMTGASIIIRESLWGRSMPEWGSRWAPQVVSGLPTFKDKPFLNIKLNIENSFKKNLIETSLFQIDIWLVW